MIVIIIIAFVGPIDSGGRGRGEALLSASLSAL